MNRRSFLSRMCGAVFASVVMLGMEPHFDIEDLNEILNRESDRMAKQITEKFLRPSPYMKLMGKSNAVIKIEINERGRSK